jgi:hypothetical protein
MEVKNDMTKATTGGTQMETSMPAVGKYNGRALGKVAGSSMDKNHPGPYYGCASEKLSSVFALNRIN